MKIVCISDSHTMHDRLDIPEGDVLVHAGDFTWRGRPQEIDSFSEWLGSLPHKHKLVIAGNHDLMFEKDPARAQSLLRNCTYLQDDGCEIDGITFWGSPWQPWFHDWAFNVARNSQQMRDIWAKVPTGVDVLITHGPPHGIRDVCPDIYSGADISVGCEVLRKEVLDRIKPKVHVFGHIHEGAGRHSEYDILFVNAAVCDRHYDVTNPIQVIEMG